MNTNYYKVLSDNVVIDAGEIFLRWQEKHRILIACPLEEAQFIQSHDGEIVWRVQWLNPAPEEAGSYEVVEAAIIDRQEYLDLRAVLDEGEHPIEPDPVVPEPEPEPEPDPEQPEEEQPMTIPQMREKIAQQERELTIMQEQIDMMLSGVTDDD